MSDNEQKYTFSEYLGPDFQRKLIWQLLVEPEFAEKTIPNLAIEYFDDQNIKRFFITMIEYFREFGKVPNLQNKSIEQAIHKYKSPTSSVEEDTLMAILDSVKLWNERVLNKHQQYDGDVVRDCTNTFIKQQEYRKLAEYIVTKTKSGQIKDSSFNFDIEAKIGKIYHIGDEEDYGTNAIDNIDRVMRKEFRQTIPTGVIAVDDLTGGGLGKGEVGLMLGPLGIGKTTFLTKVANSGFNDGKKILQVVFEDTVEQIQRKHFAIWSKIKQSDFNQDDDTDELIKKRATQHYEECIARGGKLDIMRFSEEETTIHVLKNWIARQEKKFGYKYDMIVLDYLDCLEPNRREADTHTGELSIIKSFMAMASEYDIPCWSALQANRSGLNVDVVDSHNVGGNIKRLQKSHFVMSVSKPKKEQNENLANVKIIKARFAKDGQVFEDAIFNNDSLEIRMINKYQTKNIEQKKYDQEDVDKLEEKAANKLGVVYHNKISEQLVDPEVVEVVGTTVGEIADSLMPIIRPNEGFDEPEKPPEVKNVENFAPDDLLNNLSFGDEIEEDVHKKTLREVRVSQGDILKE